MSSLTGGNEWSTECKFLPALPRPPPGWELLRHSQRKRGATDRLDLQNTAPVLDPTGMSSQIPRVILGWLAAEKFMFSGVRLPMIRRFTTRDGIVATA